MPYAEARRPPGPRHLPAIFRVALAGAGGPRLSSHPRISHHAAAALWLWQAAPSGASRSHRGRPRGLRGAAARIHRRRAACPRHRAAAGGWQRGRKRCHRARFLQHLFSWARRDRAPRLPAQPAPAPHARDRLGQLDALRPPRHPRIRPADAHRLLRPAAARRDRRRRRRDHPRPGGDAAARDLRAPRARRSPLHRQLAPRLPELRRRDAVPRGAAAAQARRGRARPRHTAALDYQPEWADRHYSEQYLLAAWLLANPRKFTILLPNAFIGFDAALREATAPLWADPALARARAHAETRAYGLLGYSFWLRVNEAQP